MDSEQYLTHPMFGLLYLICQTTDSAALYSTLYTQQLFFRVTQVERLRFEPVSRDQARRTLDVQIKQLRSKGPSEELARLMQFQKHYF